MGLRERIPRSFMRYQGIGVLMTIYGFGVAFLIDLTGLSAVLVTAVSLIPSNLLRYALYERYAFRHKDGQHGRKGGK